MNEEVNNPNPTGFVVGRKMKSILLSTAKWTMVLCVVTCIRLVYSTFMSITSIVAYSTASQQVGGRIERMMYYRSIMTIIGVIPTIILVYSLILGFQFYSKARTALLIDNEEQLTFAFEKLKYYFLWSVISAIVGFVFNIISLLGNFFALPLLM